MAENHHSEVDEILQGYLLDNVEVAGRELGVGSYSSVVEMRYKGMKCAGKRIHQSLYEQGVAGRFRVFVYSGTPLLWTPWGPGEVSSIEKCPLQG